jgi:hypothetical protein
MFISLMIKDVFRLKENSTYTFSGFAIGYAPVCFGGHFTEP